MKKEMASFLFGVPKRVYCSTAQETSELAEKLLLPQNINFSGPHSLLCNLETQKLWQCHSVADLCWWADLNSRVILYSIYSIYSESLQVSMQKEWFGYQVLPQTHRRLLKIQCFSLIYSIFWILELTWVSELYYCWPVFTFWVSPKRLHNTDTQVDAWCKVQMLWAQQFYHISTWKV